jgi:hypothetical protein
LEKLIILQTGGFACGEISTKSKSLACAFNKASKVFTTPNIFPSESTSLTSGTLIKWFIQNFLFSTAPPLGTRDFISRQLFNKKFGAEKIPPRKYMKLKNYWFTFSTFFLFW